MLEFFCDLKKIPRQEVNDQIESALSMVNLSDRANHKVGTLSGGMLRRLGIAQTLLNDPDILIYDEPTAGLDPEERLRFKSIISNVSRGKIIIISTHIVEDIDATCDKTIIMDEGNLLTMKTGEELRQCAKGKIFSCVKEEFNPGDASYFIEKEYEREGVVYYRFLSNQYKGGTPVEPNLEDGYLCILKNI